MYINGVFVLNWIRFQTLSGLPIPKYWSSTFPLRGVGAETNTILKTEKPLGREDPANDTTRFGRFCMLSRFIEGKEITTGHDKKEGVLCFYCLGKSFRHFVC